MQINSIAIILARGNSKRIPKKNIMLFNSKPLIAWTIEAALNSNLFNKVLVSTDNKEIAKISKKYGAEVPFLRYGASDDFTPSSEATIFALKQAEEFWGKKFSIVAQLMANCPLRNEENIKDLYKSFINSESSSQISCFKFGWMMPWWAFKLNNDGTHEKIFPEALNKRSQDLPDLYCPTGAFWIAKRDSLIKNKSFYTSDLRFEPLHWMSAVDIDNYDDFEIAKMCFELQKKLKKNTKK